MSYFNSCENCGIEFGKTQYVFAWCEECLVSITCSSCGNNMTMQDHRESEYQDLCLSCFFVQDEEAKTKFTEEVKEKAVKSEYSDLSDSELESKWQNSANMIGQYAMASWKKGITDEESKRLHDLAEDMQKTQSRIQDEITRRN
jgi:hypothetical protein